jgi:hypothetical protein
MAVGGEQLTLLADVEVVRDLRDAVTLVEKVKDLPTKLRRVTPSSQLGLLVSGTRIQKHRRRKTRDTTTGGLTNSPWRVVPGG